MTPEMLVPLSSQGKRSLGLLIQYGAGAGLDVQGVSPLSQPKFHAYREKR